MTRHEFSQTMNAIMNVIEDMANNKKQVTNARLEELVSKLDEVTEKVMIDGLE